MSGGGLFGPGRLNGERAERAGGAAHVRAAWQPGGRLGRVLAWGGAKVQARWRWRGSPGPFGRGCAVDEVHQRRTAGSGRNRAAYLRFLKVQGPLGKLKISPT